jgi:hypothetical protein
MNKISWKDVQTHLHETSPKPVPRAAEDFWSDFKARAALVRQEQPVAIREGMPAVLRWGTATVLALFLITLGLFALPTHSGAITQIKALEVVAPHSGVIIMNDQSGRGTILWITGMESKT